MGCIMAKTYLAVCKTSGAVFSGGLSACLQWVQNHLASHPKSIVIVIRVRPSEDGRVIAEFDDTGGRWIFGGRYVPKREISKLVRRVAHG